MSHSSVLVVGIPEFTLGRRKVLVYGIVVLEVVYVRATFSLDLAFSTQGRGDAVSLSKYVLRSDLRNVATISWHVEALLPLGPRQQLMDLSFRVLGNIARVS